MKKFDSLKNALREVRKQATDLEATYERVFLVTDYWQEEFYVSGDAFDIGEELEKDFIENHSDTTPDDLASGCKAFEYLLAENKELYPRVFKDSKIPSFKTKTPLIRRKIRVTPEYSVSFNLG